MLHFKIVLLNVQHGMHASLPLTANYFSWRRWRALSGAYALLMSLFPSKTNNFGSGGVGERRAGGGVSGDRSPRRDRQRRGRSFARGFALGVPGGAQTL